MNDSANPLAYKYDYVKEAKISAMPKFVPPTPLHKTLEKVRKEIKENNILAADLTKEQTMTVLIDLGVIRSDEKGFPVWPSYYDIRDREDGGFYLASPRSLPASSPHSHDPRRVRIPR